jgi:hypothetical protein
MATTLKEKYFSPTPAKWKKLGDALLGVSTTITTYAIVEDHKWVALVALGLGVVGKFLTNFFTEDANKNETQNPEI